MSVKSEAPSRIDRRYILAPEVDLGFAESFINAPGHLGFPTRNQYAFLRGVMGVDPAKERVFSKDRAEFVIQDIKGVEKPITPKVEKEMVNTARALINARCDEEMSFERAFTIFKREIKKRDPISLDVPVELEEGVGVGLIDFVESGDDPEEETIEHEDSSELRRRVEMRLTARDRRVLDKRFGLTGDKKTLDEIGREEGVTRERIRQIEQRALDKLRD